MHAAGRHPQARPLAEPKSRRHSSSSASHGHLLPRSIKLIAPVTGMRLDLSGQALYSCSRAVHPAFSESNRRSCAARYSLCEGRSLVRLAPRVMTSSAISFASWAVRPLMACARSAPTVRSQRGCRRDAYAAIFLLMPRCFSIAPMRSSVETCNGERGLQARLRRGKDVSGGH